MRAERVNEKIFQNGVQNNPFHITQVNLQTIYPRTGFAFCLFYFSAELLYLHRSPHCRRVCSRDWVIRFKPYGNLKQWLSQRNKWQDCPGRPPDISNLSAFQQIDAWIMTQKWQNRPKQHSHILIKKNPAPASATAALAMVRNFFYATHSVTAK